MANRKATFAKRQRETDLKDRAKQKEDRRTQKRGEVREAKGPQIAWDEAVYAVTTSDDPPLEGANPEGEGEGELDAKGAADAKGTADAKGDPRPLLQPAVASATAASSDVIPAAVSAAPPAKPAAAPAKAGPATKPATSPNPAAPRRVG